MTSWWEGAAKLLSAGPLGLGAIMVLVTGLILISGKTVEQGRLKLALSMLLAGCVLVLAGFGVLILQTNAAEADAAARLALAKASLPHQVYFRVEPLNSDATFPKPDIIVNTVKLDELTYTILSDVTVIVDVTKALKQAGKVQTELELSTDKTETNRATIEANRKIKAQVSADIDTSIAQIQRSVQLMTQSCPGGAHGENPFHFNDLVSLTNAVSAALQNTKSLLAGGG